MTEEQKNNYITLLDSVNQSDIHEILKKYKEDNKDDIKLTGNKTFLINNLLDAVKGGIITEFDVQSLIKDSEEFGDQYIFFFKPIDNLVINKYNDGIKIADSIIHPSVRSRFPKLNLKPTSFEWADFRYPYRGISGSWLIKIYDKKVREIKADEKINSAIRERYVTYRTIESRLIYLVEWNDAKQLEIKISRTSFDSTKSLESSLKLIKKNIYNNGSGIDMHTEVTPLDLTSCINNILDNSVVNRKIYTLLNVTLLDAEFGKASIRCYDDQGTSDLLSDDSRKKAIEAYKEGGGRADGIAVKFLADGSNGELKSDINVIIGKEAINKIIIPAKIKPQEYRYVKRKIAEFS
ncbi:hypothetical protein ACQKCJ_08835 [Flavobacterium sp. NPDC079362]|uniref:hypothetical protein n=1 Tax=Flavobacterium sp. NPDC079362 TaxID=3390566 RepID=UPI003D0007A3